MSFILEYIPLSCIRLWVGTHIFGQITDYPMKMLYHEQNITSIVKWWVFSDSQVFFDTIKLAFRSLTLTHLVPWLPFHVGKKFSPSDWDQYRFSEKNPQIVIVDIYCSFCRAIYSRDAKDQFDISIISNTDVQILNNGKIL